MAADREAALIHAVAAAVGGLMVAVEAGDPLQTIGALNQLLAVLIEHRDAPADVALLRAVALHQ